VNVDVEAAQLQKAGRVTHQDHTTMMATTLDQARMLELATTQLVAGLMQENASAAAHAERMALARCQAALTRAHAL
jgi:hypothetical protein